MYKYILLITILFTQLSAKYDIGDTISDDDQNMSFSYCYPDDLTSTFRLGNSLGKVVMIEMTATW